MITLFTVLFFMYVLPLWFMFRLWYFTKDRESYRGGFDGADKVFSVFMIFIVSWLGFIISLSVANPKRNDLRRTFFLKANDKSMAAKIFWYRVRVLLLRLLFIKESA